MKNRHKGINAMLAMSVLYCSVGMAFAQAGPTGIGTRNPQGPLHVDGAKDNPTTGVLTPSGMQAANDVIVTNTGFVGVGVFTPKVKLDMRSAGSQNAFGLGTTTMLASAAGAGAIRYEPNVVRIQTSDGATWFSTVILPTKAVVVARMTTSFSVPRSADVNITGWNQVKDDTNAFDESTGIFTAPRAGVYTFQLTYNFVSGLVEASSEVTAQFYSPTTNTVLARSFKTFAYGNEAAQVGGSAIITLSLAANQQVRPQLRQNITASGARDLRVNANWTHFDAGFNNLTIIEN